jgi:hypothetical protein
MIERSAKDYARLSPFADSFIFSNPLFGSIQVRDVDIDRSSEPREYTYAQEYAQRKDRGHERKAPK